MARKKRAKVFVLYTGGTIGMVPSDPDNPASPLVPAKKEDLARYVHGFGKEEGIDWEIENLVDLNGKVVDPIDSSDVDADHWIYMANAIEEVYDDYDGFVVLHGTDTMAYTASGLSFLLKNLAKPVVVTGSQLPIANPRTDGVQNFVNSLYIAGYKATGLPLVPEVVICFGVSLLRGNRSRKISAASWQGFETPNCPPLGTIGEHIKINTDVVLDPANNERAPFYADKSLCRDVLDVGLFPGLQPRHLNAILSQEVLRGIVLRTFGAGNAPGHPTFLKVIEEAVEGKGQSGKVLVNVTQCVEGMVEMGVYAASSGLLERGVISGLDLTPEAALAKLMSILETENDPDEIRQQMQINLRGEQSESLFDVRCGKVGDEVSPVGIVKTVAKPSGQFQLSELKRAILRISEVGFSNANDGEDVGLRVFINMPNADEKTPVADPHFAVALEDSYRGPASTSFIQDITPTIERVGEPGRPINITLVPVDGKKIWYDGLYLALFA